MSPCNFRELRGLISTNEGSFELEEPLDFTVCGGRGMDVWQRGEQYEIKDRKGRNVARPALFVSSAVKSERLKLRGNCPRDSRDSLVLVESASVLDIARAPMPF